MNSVKAFVVGGSICTLAMLLNNMLMESGLNKEDAGSVTTITLIMAAQLLTGLGVFDTIGKFAGAGVIVPITGYANAVVSSAIEYKNEGIVLGVGAKLFSVAGPVLVSGISSAAIVGLIYWIAGNIGG